MVANTKQQTKCLIDAIEKGKALFENRGNLNVSRKKPPSQKHYGKHHDNTMAIITCITLHYTTTIVV